MVIKIQGKDKELKYSFNSFRHMKDFNLRDLEDVENQPFKILDVATVLLRGALNHSPKEFVGEEVIVEFIEEYIEENSIAELIEELMSMLQDSNFFKSLQKMEKSKKVKKK